MPPRPIGDRPMTATERQRRRRARLAQERARATDETLIGLRTTLGRVSRFLTTQPAPAELAVVLADLDGPTLPVPWLVEAAAWLIQFAAAYEASLPEKRELVTDRRG